MEIADYCPFSQEFSWHVGGEYQRSSYCRIQENQPGKMSFTHILHLQAEWKVSFAYSFLGGSVFFACS